MEPETVSSQRDAELEALRSRIAELERENAEMAARANAAIARAQEQAYWLDRWGVDLNRVMALPGAEELRASLRAVRSVYRFARERIVRPVQRLLGR